MPIDAIAPGPPPARRVPLALGVLFLLLLFVLVATLGSLNLSMQPAAPVSTAAPTPAATTTPQPALFTAACALAAQQLRSGNPADAAATLEAVGITDVLITESRTTADPVPAADCRATWTIATAAAPDEPEPPGTPPMTTGKAWDAFVKSWITPLAGFGGFIAGGWLALFVVARLFVELPVVRSRSSSVVGRWWTALIGWGLLIVSPIAFALAASTAIDDRDIPLLIAITVLGLFGAVTLSVWLASLRRMQFTVTAAEGITGPAALDRVDVITQLRSMIGSGRGRIEVPAGPQIDIDAALTSLSTSKWVAAVQKIVLFLVGIVPWQVSVQQSTATDASVTVARHGQLQASQRISLSDDSLVSLAPHDPPGASRLLATFVAATIIVALREKYPADIEPGLYGATRVRGIALQSIAAQWNLGPQPPTRAIAILQKAVEADPFNELARSTLDYAEHRGDTSSPDILAFIERLTDRIERRLPVATEDDLLLSSWRITRAAMIRNLAALTSKAGPVGSDERRNARKEALTHVNTAATDMRAWLETASHSDDSRPSRARARISLVALDAISRDFDPRDDGRPSTRDIRVRIAELDAYEEITTNPGMAYSLACVHLRWHEGTFADAVVKKLLATATQSSIYRSFAERDPELSTAPDQKGRRRWLKAIAAADKAKRRRLRADRG